MCGRTELCIRRGVAGIVGRTARAGSDRAASTPRAEPVWRSA